MPLKDIIFMLVHRGYRNLKSHRWINRLPFRLTKKELLHPGAIKVHQLRWSWSAIVGFTEKKIAERCERPEDCLQILPVWNGPECETVGTETLRRSSEWKYETFKLHKVSLVFSWHRMLLVLHQLRLPVVYRFRISWWAVITQQENKTQRKKRRKTSHGIRKILHVVIRFFGYNLFSKIF